jgi:LmbE family N-acetylglucosaminyl deacetylase
MDGIRKALSDRVATIRPCAVCTVAYEGGHPDHDACHWATVQAAGESVEAADVLEFPTYRRGGRLFTAGVLLPGEGAILRTTLGPEGLRLKTLILRRHGLHGVFLRWFLQLFLDRRQLSIGEQYRLVPERNYLNPPHPGRLGYELYTRFRFADFRRMVQECGG